MLFLAVARIGQTSFSKLSLVTTGLDPVIHAELTLGMDCRIRSGNDDLPAVMPAPVAGIHVFGPIDKTWMAGTSPAMTPANL